MASGYQSISFQNCQFLQFTEDMEFLETTGWQFSVLRKMTIKGFLLELQNQDGTNAVLTDLANLRQDFSQYYPAIWINGRNFGSGRIISIESTSSDLYVRSQDYVVKLECELRLDELARETFNTTGIDNSGLSFLLTEQLPGRLMRSLKYSFVLTRNDDRYSYVQSLNVATKQMSDCLQRVQQFATALFALTGPATQFADVAMSLENAGYKPIYTEKIDLINNEFAFVLRVEATNPDFVNNLSVDQNFSYVMAENGIVNVTENLKAKNLFYGLPNIQYYVTGALSGCQNVFNAYNNETFSLYPLNPTPVVWISGYDEPNRTVNYQVTFTNDPKYNTSYTWEYTEDVVKNGAYLNCTENGKIVGSGETSSIRFSNALAAYPGIYAGIYARVSPNLLNSYLVNTTYAQNQYKGEITYAQTYSENPIYSDTTAITTQINVEDKFKTPIWNRFEIPNYGIISQALTSTGIQGLKLGERTCTVEIQGRKLSTEATLKASGQAYANQYVPNTYDTVYLTNVNYSFLPIEKKFSLKAVWNYN